MFAVVAVLLATTSDSAGAAPELTVAVVSTRTNPHQPFGEAPTPAIERAAARLNAAGGIAGRPLRVVPFLEDCTRQGALAVAQSVATLKPDLVIGHLCRSAALAAAEIYAKAGILFIAPGVREPRLTMPPAGPLVFRLAGRDDRLAAETAAFVAERFPAMSVALIADRTLQASRLAVALAAALDERGVAIAAREALEFRRGDL